MGKKREEELLRNYVTLRFRDADHKRLWSAAWKDRRNVAALCRNFILSELPKKEEELAREAAEVQQREKTIHFASTGS